MRNDLASAAGQVVAIGMEWIAARGGDEMQEYTAPQMGARAVKRGRSRQRADEQGGTNSRQ